MKRQSLSGLAVLLLLLCFGLWGCSGDPELERNSDVNAQNGGDGVGDLDSDGDSDGDGLAGDGDNSTGDGDENGEADQDGDADQDSDEDDESRWIHEDGRWDPPETTFTLRSRDVGAGLYFADVQESFPDVNWQELDRLYIPAGHYRLLFLGVWIN